MPRSSKVLFGSCFQLWGDPRALVQITVRISCIDMLNVHPADEHLFSTVRFVSADEWRLFMDTAFSIDPRLAIRLVQR